MLFPKPRHWQTRAGVFLTSQCITLFGSSLVQMAIVWHATLLTGSGVWVAAFYACSYLPQFLVSTLGGALADRVGRRLLIGGADALIALATLLACLLIPEVEGTAAMLPLLALSVLRSVGAGVQTPAVGAAIPDIVPDDALPRYNGVNAAMQATVQLAAPAAAGVLLSFGDLRSVMLVDVATAAAGISLLSLVPIPRPSGKSEASAISEAAEGIRYALSRREVALPLGVYASLTLLSIPGGYLAGLFVSQEFGGAWWSLAAVEVVGFLGMALGGLLVGRVAAAGRGVVAAGRGVVAAGLGLFGSMSMAMAASDSLPLYLALMCVYGIALSVTQASVTTMIQRGADSAMRGRVFGLASTIYAGCLPVGMLVIGPASDLVPLRAIMAATGALGACLAIALFRRGSRA